MTIATVYAVFADSAEADRIGRAMIEGGYAACVNILAPCRSIYCWDGAIEDAEEVPALFKTTADDARRLVTAIAALHSYETPAITAWPVLATTPDYATWVASSVG